MTDTEEIYEVALAPEYYEARKTAGGGTVRDVVPYEGATAYVSDGASWGIRYDDDAVEWLDRAANLPASVELDRVGRGRDADVGRRFADDTSLVAGQTPEYRDLLRETTTGSAWELYVVREYDALDSMARSGNRKELLWFPDERRAGICYGGDSAWTDAVSPEQAIWRYLLGEMIA